MLDITCTVLQKLVIAMKCRVITLFTVYLSGCRIWGGDFIITLNFILCISSDGV